MKKWVNKGRRNTGLTLLLSIMLVFVFMGGVVFWISQKITREMSDSAIQNLSESLDLIQCTIESILRNGAEFQQLVARDVAAAEDPEEYVRTYVKNTTMVKLSLVLSGEGQGVSSTGEAFDPASLDFSAGGEIGGLPVSHSYVNYMGTWAYTLKCPVERDGQEIGVLYAEYVYDSLDRSLPEGFYNKQAMLYIMDAGNSRFVLKPKGMGQRSAGHLNLSDFYRANSITDPGLQEEVSQCLEDGTNILFYHDIREKNSLNYMWAVNGGTLFLVGYVPVEAIQQEGDTVNQNITIVVMVMLVAFFLCFLVYLINQRQQEKDRREREAERELHSRQLAEALQAAQIASQSKTMFLSNMSHDIRTPMNAVLGFTTLLALDAEDPVKVREYTKKITASGQHLLSLINDVLDVSKIESGKVVLNIEEFSLSSLMASVRAIIQPMADAKGQAFHIEAAGIRHEYLLGDQTRMDQVLINLLSNAVKYTQAGGSIWLRILGLEQRSSQYARLRIEVEDNGYGMTPEYLETIFDAFTRAENSTTNKVQGTGLGMAITKSIVELMGGTIEVQSQVDKGSLFRVEMEFRIPERQADLAFWKESGISRILAVGCGLEDLMDMQALLEGAGIAVVSARTCPDALRLLSGGEAGFQAVLLDWESQGPGALASAQQLRQALPAPSPLLLLSGDEGMGEARGLENTGVLAKPFFVSALKEKLMEMQAGPVPPRPDGEGPSLEGLCFLAAEDNEINAEILVELLELDGAACQVVENGQLAVERFAACAPGEFDAILMDVQMPVMNGYEATRAIRALPREDAGRIPIIAMTANAFAEDEKAALEAGMDAHVAKPIDIALLKRVVRQYTTREE
ncbi:response regulator [bacterium D16-76]|nr:response regulator [bacterium D16-76]